LQGRRRSRFLEPRRALLDNRAPPFGILQQQHASVGRDFAAVEVGANTWPT
jgi:hypothetical protein